MTADEPTWMTDVADRQEHGIDERRWAVGHALGVYIALCGKLVLPRSLTAPCGRRCPRCAYLAAPPLAPTRVARLLRLMVS
ncbi:MAG TPA: hypothetical protein VK735_18540 [Pseudonocardia sp.]|uniref:hypothetical protein n=1 Tax=Pseudonocardia sp. TaxID=60912 RepID=UPI002CD14ACC|nr:hypothetical protein [Pseudonocardia sp.]HTF49445.1 hypothetical protein [Pseudonocardia sp.]